MSERYSAKKLKREWAARIAQGEKPHDPRQDAIDAQEAFERRRAIQQLRGAPRADMLCHHGTPWLSCLICSKPRTKP